MLVCSDPAQSLIRFAPEFHSMCGTPAGSSLITEIDTESSHQIGPSSLFCLRPAGVALSHCFTGLKSPVTVSSKITVMLLSSRHRSALNGRARLRPAARPGIEKVTHACWSPPRAPCYQKRAAGQALAPLPPILLNYRYFLQNLCKAVFDFNFFSAKIFFHFLEFLCI